MTRWIVFEPPVEQQGDNPRAATGPSERAVFVRDAFAKWAVLFSFLWLLRYRLILSGILAFVVSIGFGLLAERPGLGVAAAVLPLLVGVMVGLEGPSLRAARYRRKGYVEAAVVDAPDEEEAAILYYAGTTVEPGEDDAGLSAPPAPFPRMARAAYDGSRMLRAESRSLLDPATRR